MYRKPKLADTEKGKCPIRGFQAYVTLSGVSFLLFSRCEVCTAGLSKAFWVKGP